MRAATYARLSDDGLSIPDQQKTARKYAEDRGWRVVAEFKDEHRSAFRKIEREEFEALLRAASDGKIDVIIARHQDRLLRHPETYSRLLEVCVRRNIEIHLYGSGGFLDLSTSQGGFMGMMNTAIAWQESAIRSERVRAAVERNTRAGKRTGGGSRPFGYKIIRHDQGDGARRRWRIVGEELEPTEAELIKEAATRVLRGESLRSIAMDWNKRGIKTVGASSTKPKHGRWDQDRDARLWHGSMIRRVLVSPRIAGLREHHGEVITKDGEPVKAAWPAIISREEHDRLVGLLKDPSRRPMNYGRPRVYPLAGLLRCGSCGGKLITYLQPKQGRGYGCRKDENPDCGARVRIAAEALEAYVEGYVIDQWRNPEAIKIAQSDVDRMARIRKITDEMRQLQEQKNEALRMKLRKEVDTKTFREVTAEIDAAHDQLAREHKRLASEAAMPELPDASLAWEDLSSEDRRALTEMLVDKIVVAPHPHKIVDGRRHYTIRAIAYQDPEMEAERLKAVHEERVKIVPRV